MVRFATFIVFLGIIVSVVRCEKLPKSEKDAKVDLKICTVDDIRVFSRSFDTCIYDEENVISFTDPEKLVSSILELSGACVENSTQKCRPNRKGFVAIIDQIIFHVQDYLYTTLGNATKEKEKIKDFECMDGNLSASTYKTCFEDTFVNDVVDVDGTLEKQFQESVDKAISCTNKFHNLCSESAKTRINKMVRKILKVDVIEKKDVEKSPVIEREEPKTRWYDPIIRPIIAISKAIWSAIKWLLGL